MMQKHTASVCFLNILHLKYAQYMLKFFSMNEKIYNVRINKDEVLRYLGYVSSRSPDDACSSAGDGGSNGEEHSCSCIDAAVDAQINNCIKKITQAALPKYVYRVFDIERIEKNACGCYAQDHGNIGDNSEKIMLSGTSAEIIGHDAAVLLRDCSACIVMAATLGQKCEMMLRRAQITDMTEAVILDSCASSAIESICEQLNDDLRSEYLSAGKFLTDRYSPGYGDMPLTMQPELCGLLQTEKRIGLSVSPGLTLIPSKSVTAIIGIADRPQKMREVSCDSCRLRDTCKIREAGGSCGRSK